MCTRVFWSENDVAKVVARTLDFSVPDEPRLWWLPAGMTRQGHPDLPAVAWTSGFASVSVAEWDQAYLEGLNSAGLAAHALMYTTAEYEPVDDRPALATSLWVHYILDNFDNVADAVAALADVRVTPVEILGIPMGVHVAIEDVHGDCAIFEPTDGTMVVHHGPEFQIMANSPGLDEQLANRVRYRPFGGELPPPGDITSLDRFVRASYFHHYLTPPADSREAAGGVMQVVMSVSKPPGAPYPDGDIYPTRWQSTSDLTNLDFYFWSRTSPALVWLSMAELAGQEAALSVDLFTPGLAGDLVPHLAPGRSAPTG